MGSWADERELEKPTRIPNKAGFERYSSQTRTRSFKDSNFPQVPHQSTNHFI